MSAAEQRQEGFQVQASGGSRGGGELVLCAPSSPHSEAGAGGVLSAVAWQGRDWSRPDPQGPGGRRDPAPLRHLLQYHLSALFAGVLWPL